MKKLILSLLLIPFGMQVFAQLTATISTYSNVTCYGSCNGSATATASGGTAPYTFLWNTVPGQTTATAMGLCAGTYSVTVTDDASATTVTSVTITQPAPIYITLSTIDVFCFGMCNGVIVTSVTGGSPPYTYLWSNLTTTANITNLCAGSYNLTVTDANGCVNTAVAIITQPTQLTASTTSTPDTCSQEMGTASVLASGGSAPYSYMWSYGVSSNYLITGLPAGFYSVTVTEANGCTDVAMAVVGNYAPDFTLGNNFSSCIGVCDTLVPGLTGLSMPVSYEWSDLSTNDSLVICPSSSGTYSLTLTDGLGCSVSHSVTVNIVEHCNTISGFVYEDLDNDGIKDPGEDPVSNRLIQFVPGPLYATSDINGFYQLLVDTGNFTITVPNSESYVTFNPIQQSAVLYSSYETDSLNNFGMHIISHSDLKVNLYADNMRPGFSSQYYLWYVNEGTDTMDVTLKLYMDAIPVYTGASLTPSDITGDTLTWSVADMLPGTHSQIYIDITIPNTTALGTLITSNAVIEPIAGDTVPANNFSTCTKTVIGSWDPNDKAVSPEGVFPPSLIASGDYLTYTIRFQNTGTDTAFNIHIVDTLSANLNLSTFELVSYSHPCSFNLHDEGIVDFVFNNILLPDSNVNQAGSNGYVRYKVKPKSTLVIGDEVENTAYIYFDFNQPVMTNTVSTIIDNPSVINYSAGSREKLALWPNPAQGDFTIACNLKNAGTVCVEITDALGKIVLKEQLQQPVAGEFLVPIHVDGIGLYIVKLISNDGCYTARVMLTK